MWNGTGGSQQPPHPKFTDATTDDTKDVDACLAATTTAASPTMISNHQNHYCHSDPLRRRRRQRRDDDEHSSCIADDDVYVIRHSARADRDERNWMPLPGHSRDDTHLSNNGQAATEQLTRRLDDVKIRYIVSSPFLRCLQTVAPIAIRKKLRIQIEPGICEVLNDGYYPPGFLDPQQLVESHRFPIDVDYRPVVSREELRPERSDGEAAERSRRVALILRERLQGPILFCGHGASCLGITNAFGGSGYVGYSSLSHFRRDDKGWHVVTMGDVSFLSEHLKRQSEASAW
jgi:transcription factor C subunit 7